MNVRGLTAAATGSLVLAAALGLYACSGSGFSNPVAPPPPSRPGTIVVHVLSIGEDLDPDGYLLTLADSDTRTVSASGTVTFEAVVVGTHTLRLSGNAINCSAGQGGDARTVTVRSGETVNIQFAIVCETLAPQLVSMIPNPIEWTARVYESSSVTAIVSFRDVDANLTGALIQIVSDPDDLFLGLAEGRVTLAPNALTDGAFPLRFSRTVPAGANVGIPRGCPCTSTVVMDLILEDASGRRSPPFRFTLLVTLIDDRVG